MSEDVDGQIITGLENECDRLTAINTELLGVLESSRLALTECANILRPQFPGIANHVVPAHIKLIDSALTKARE